MKKLVYSLFGLMLLPYLFLATSVTDGADLSDKRGMNCTVSRIEKYKTVVGLSMVHYGGFYMAGNEYIILPKFNINDDVFFADCAGKELMIGSTKWIKLGDKINVHARKQEIRLFGHKLFEEDSIYMFSNSWN